MRHPATHTETARLGLGGHPYHDGRCPPIACPPHRCRHVAHGAGGDAAIIGLCPSFLYLGGAGVWPHGTLLAPLDVGHAAVSLFVFDVGGGIEGSAAAAEGRHDCNPPKPKKKGREEEKREHDDHHHPYRVGRGGGGNAESDAIPSNEKKGHKRGTALYSWWRVAVV